MFPGVPQSIIRRELGRSTSLQEAIDRLLVYTSTHASEPSSAAPTVNSNDTTADVSGAPSASRSSSASIVLGRDRTTYPFILNSDKQPPTLKYVVTDERLAEDILNKPDTIDLETWKHNSQVREEMLLRKKQLMVMKARQYVP